MYPNTNLQPGQTGPEVKKLQDFLVSKGLMTPQEVATGPGIYGPKTTAAVKKFQEMNKVDNTTGPGFWGPRTISAASGAGASVSNVGGNEPTEENVNRLMKEIEDKANTTTNTYLKQLIEKNGLAAIDNAINTGDLSGITDYTGQPFSPEVQQKALVDAERDTKAYHDALKTKETADTETALAQKQADYQDYLIKSGEQFQADKTAADQSAADRGVLFSGGRVQKEKNLQTAYERDQATKLRNLTSDIGGISRDYQYAYGKDATNGLSSYYKAGANTYNPNVATGGVGSAGLSSIYNPNSYDLGSGTRVKERQIDINKRAAGFMKNTANKLLATGYQNKI